MVYVYDILVNFNEKIIDFYDWDKNDQIRHIRKMPIFKVSSKVIMDIMFNKVKINSEIINLIKDKTEVFNLRSVNTLPFVCTFVSAETAVAVSMNKNGIVLEKSKFLVNEELEIIGVGNKLKKIDLDYSILEIENHSLLLRSEEKILDEMIREINLLKDNEEVINYLYYEWFNKPCTKNAYEELIFDLKKDFTPRHEELLNLLNILKVKK